MMEPSNGAPYERGSMLGLSGPWFSTLAPDPPLLSLRGEGKGDLLARKRDAAEKVRELLAGPESVRSSFPRTLRRVKEDGLVIEELEWTLPYGRPTQAVLLVPEDRKGRLPGFLALHDHSGMKYFGKAKIVKAGSPQHPLMQEHQRYCYGGRGWADELARRGYAVLVHDTFAFGSRRIRNDEVPPEIAGAPPEHEPIGIEEVVDYNRWAAGQESVVARSLFCAGTTWPGVTWVEDRVALEHLLSRDEVDPERVGCGGLSGGGMRSSFLAGLDPRVRAAFCAGFMTTWRDFLLHKSHTHTWMAYVPLLPRFLDFPEILGLRAPLPTLVVNCRDDDLYTVPEMDRAAGILADVFRTAGEPGALEVRTYPGPHRLDGEMQEDTFSWLDRHLRG